MEWMSLSKRLPDILKKYKYAILVLAVGLVLMAIPSGTDRENTTDEAPVEIKLQTSVSQELAALLTQIEGVGKVEVMLTRASGEETVFQTDQDISMGNDTQSTRQETVMTTDTQRNQTGLIKQINPARYLGAVIVCQGADSPSVRFAVVDAVSKATGLGSDRISVLKMK